MGRIFLLFSKLCLLFFFFFFQEGNAQTLIINEVSNGPSGSKEYVELVVVDTAVVYDCNSSTPPCIDIRNWIFDDNSGYHSSTGVAAGAVRFSNNSLWSCVPVGTIILLYNDADPNPAVPASDFSVSDGNCRLVIPISSSLMETNSTTPGAVACSYPSTGWTNGGNWTNTALANTGDCARIVNLAGCEVFSLCYGAANTNTLIYFSGAGGQTCYYFNNGDPTLNANWSSGSASPSPGSQTPGIANNAANQAYISQFNNGCSPITPLTASASVTSNASCSCTGSASATASGSLDGYSYNWLDASYVPIGQTSSSAVNLCAGTYYCVVTSGIGCKDTVSVSISGSSSGSLTVSSTSVCQGNPGTITASPTISGGTFSWSPGGQNTASITVSPSATTIYTCTYTNGGCSSTANGTVTVNSGLSVDAGPAVTICSGSSAVLSATGASSYSWNNGIGNGNNITVSPTSTTHYIVTGSDASGCSGIDSVLITVSGLPTATISGTTTVCQNAADPVITFTGANGVAPYTFTYNINGGANQTVSSGAGSTATVTASTSSSGTFTYTLVSVSSSTGCNQSQTGGAVVTVNSLPTAAISGTATICQGGTAPSITFTGSGTTAPFTFTYNINGGANQTVTSIGSSVTVSVPTVTSGIFTYNLVGVTGSNSCSQTQSGTATVTVGPLPTAQIQGDATVCQNDASPLVTFTGANGVAPYSFDYTINGGAVQTATTTGNNSSVTVSVPTGTAGTYTYALQNVSTPNGCSQTQNGSVSIVVNALPVANPQADTALCAGSTTNQVNFSSTPSGATFGWTNSDPGIGLAANGIGSVPSFTALNSGNTPVTATITYAPTLNGCIGSPETFTITVSNTPVSFAGADVGLCQNSTGAQIGTTSQAGLSYSWSPATGLSNPNGSSTNVSTATAGSTTYTVTTTNVLGCYSTDDVVVTINPLPTVGFVPDKTSGCAPLEVRFTNTSSSNSVNCDWFFGDGGTDNGCGGVTYTFETPGVWDVTLVVTDNNGCQNSLTQSDLITVLPEVYAKFSADHYQITSLDPAFQFTNYSQNATNYSWTFGDGEVSSVQDPNHTYDNVTQGYVVILVASNEFGCIDSAKQTITPVDDLIFYVPNAFTPDGDEYNNTFYPVFTSGFDEMSYGMYIFDRWGEIIFESHDWNIGWDGTYHNVMCKEGVYTWKILVKEKNRDKHHEYHGHITLLK